MVEEFANALYLDALKIVSKYPFIKLFGEALNKELKSAFKIQRKNSI